MAFTIPDKGEGLSNTQSIMFQEYLDVLAAGISGVDCVLTGCAVTAQGSPDMTVAVASGTVLSNGVLQTVTSGNVTITTADSTNPRIDLVVVNSSGTKAARAGTAAAAPKPPARTANDVVLAVVYVPASDTTIATNQIVDLRVLREYLLGNPTSDDGQALGTTSLKWSDLHLASGAVINFNNGNVTITHSSGVLTVAGGGIVLAAGTTSLAPIKLQAGTNLTTAEDGAIEMDGYCLYGCTDAGNRGVIPIEHIIRADSTRTFTSNTSQQAIFNSPASGTLTLETGCYLFECLLSMDTMSATSGNGKFSLNSGGTATVGSILYLAMGRDAALDAVGAVGGIAEAQATVAAADTVTAATGTVVTIYVRGTFEVTGAGTIIPSFALTTAAAAVVKVGSFFKCNRIGSTSMASVGQWS